MNAKNRGVDVQISLEGNVYGTPAINRPVYEFFKQHNIKVSYTDNNRFTFTHAKFWIIDDIYAISTGNWTRSFFDKNREYIFLGRDNSTRNFLEFIFQKDFLHESFSQLSDIPPQVVISPLNARQKILEFISKTQDSIYIYVQSITDPEVIAALEKLKNS